MSYFSFAPVVILMISAAPAPAAEEPAAVLWGDDQVSGKYRVWDQLSAAYPDETGEDWNDLSAEERSARLKKAEAVCARADNALAATNGQTDAAAIMAMPDATISGIGTCLADGETAAPALREKKQRLLLIKQRSEAGQLSADDIKWLEENRLQLADANFQDTATKEGLEAQNRQQKKIGETADKKYASLKEKKNLGSSGLSGLYDGGKGQPEGRENTAVQLSKQKSPAAAMTGDRSSKKKLSFAPPPEVELTEEFKGKKGYKEMKKDNEYNKVMDEVDKDGEAAAAKGTKLKAAGYAGLKSVYNVSKDFDETFINNPSPKNEDVQQVIDRIKSKAKNPDEAWQIAYQMRQKRDFPALRDAEHYLYACSEADESRWKAARTVITTPLYSISKLPGLRSVFHDDTTSPPSMTEIKWGLKGAKDCVK